MGLMDESVYNRYGHIIVEKELPPVCKFFVGCQDNGSVFIDGIDQLK